MADSESSPRSPAEPEFVALAERVGVPSRAKGLQTAIGGYLLRHDLDREIQKQGFSPLLAAKLQADTFVQGLYEARLERLAQASATLDGPVLRGLAVLNPAVYSRLAQMLAGLAGSEAPLSTIGALIESILQERKHDESPDNRSA